jgi:hypothetical protein
MTESNRSPVEAVQTYWDHLEAGAFEEAAAQFTEDCYYIHMPIFEHRTVIRGRDELLHYFRDIRGVRDLDHILEKQVQDDRKGVVHGTGRGDDIDDEHVFAAFAELAGDEIAYYSITNRVKDSEL